MASLLPKEFAALWPRKESRFAPFPHRERVGHVSEGSLVIGWIAVPSMQGGPVHEFCNDGQIAAATYGSDVFGAVLTHVQSPTGAAEDRITFDSLRYPAGDEGPPERSAFG
jgi:hypothetical protein